MTDDHFTSPLAKSEPDTRPRHLRYAEQRFDSPEPWRLVIDPREGRTRFQKASDPSKREALSYDRALEIAGAFPQHTHLITIIEPPTEDTTMPTETTTREITLSQPWYSYTELTQLTGLSRDTFKLHRDELTWQKDGDWVTAPTRFRADHKLISFLSERGFDVGVTAGSLSDEPEGAEDPQVTAEAPQTAEETPQVSEPTAPAPEIADRVAREASGDGQAYTVHKVYEGPFIPAPDVQPIEDDEPDLADRLVEMTSVRLSPEMERVREVAEQAGEAQDQAARVDVEATLQEAIARFVAAYVAGEDAEAVARHVDVVSTAAWEAVAWHMAKAERLSAALDRVARVRDACAA